MVLESEGVRKLQEHLVHVKLRYAEREAELLGRCKAAEKECAKLKTEMEIAKDELQLCWSYVRQLKQDNSVKYRFEERDDWKALIASIQEDRQRLRRENKRLREEHGLSHHDNDGPLSPDHRSQAMLPRRVTHQVPESRGKLSFASSLFTFWSSPRHQYRSGEARRKNTFSERTQSPDTSPHKSHRSRRPTTGSQLAAVLVI